MDSNSLSFVPRSWVIAMKKRNSIVLIHIREIATSQCLPISCDVTWKDNMMTMVTMIIMTFIIYYISILVTFIIITQLQSAGFLCRSTNDFCDLEEYCDGTSALCPVDSYKHDGTACSAGGVSWVVPRFSKF